MKIVGLLAATLLALATSGCSETRTDVSEQPEFKHLVGLEYEVIGTVDAYGIRDHSGAPVKHVTLIPKPGIDGRYVGFRVRLQPGSTIVVQRVIKTNRWPDPNMSYDVILKGTPLPTAAPVQIDLFRGNEGNTASELNPKLYRKLGPEAELPSTLRRPEDRRLRHAETYAYAAKGKVS